MKKASLHKPFQSGHSLEYIKDALDSEVLSSGGKYADACRKWFSKNYQANSIFLTSSCTDALEMSALLAGLQPGDEVILPSYTFVSTANAYSLRGCTLKFADSLPLIPNIGIETILPMVTEKTRAIVVMHYAGIAVDMDPIISLAHNNRWFVIEDAAQAIGAKYKNKMLGTIADMACISFHATKIINSGEGGCCIINNPSLDKRAEIVFEKGTNRSAFQRNEVSKYEWLEHGSSFGMSELQAAFLYSQLQEFDEQISHRKKIWDFYVTLLKEFETAGMISLPQVPDFADVNGTHFYVVLNDSEQRTQLKNYLLENNVESASHYLALHRSPFYNNRLNQNLPNADRFESCLLRLPIHEDIDESDVLNICGLIYAFFKKYH
jgi:dTDP-4-amino-4,6-dideoxygalactose transaminase